MPLEDVNQRILVLGASGANELAKFSSLRALPSSAHFSRV